MTYKKLQIRNKKNELVMPLVNATMEKAQVWIARYASRSNEFKSVEDYKVIIVQE